jgi:hypothetical protein
MIDFWGYARECVGLLFLVVWAIGIAFFRGARERSEG